MATKPTFLTIYDLCCIGTAFLKMFTKIRQKRQIFTFSDSAHDTLLSNLFQKLEGM